MSDCLAEEIGFCTRAVTSASFMFLYSLKDMSSIIISSTADGVQTWPIFSNSVILLQL